MLGAALAAEGWAVRGTSRSEDGIRAIEDAGLTAAIADPERPGTVLELVGDVTVVHWLLGSASGSPEDLSAIHGPRLERLLEHLVDTPVRGFVYEGAGTVGPAELGGGAQIVRDASERWRIPAAIVRSDPSEPEGWLRETVGATVSLLG